MLMKFNFLYFWYNLKKNSNEILLCAKINWKVNYRCLWVVFILKIFINDSNVMNFNSDLIRGS